MLLVLNFNSPSDINAAPANDIKVTYSFMPSANDVKVNTRSGDIHKRSEIKIFRHTVCEKHKLEVRSAPSAKEVKLNYSRTPRLQRTLN